MNKFIKFIKDPFGYKARLLELECQVIRLTNLITAEIDQMHKLTSTDIEMSYRGKCSIILTGQYRGRGFIKFYDMDLDEFKYTVERYKDNNRRSTFRVEDLPHWGQGSFIL